MIGQAPSTKKYDRCPFCQSQNLMYTEKNAAVKCLYCSRIMDKNSFSPVVVAAFRKNTKKEASQKTFKPHKKKQLIIPQSSGSMKCRICGGRLSSGGVCWECSR